MGKYVDLPSIIQVIGGVYNNPTLLDEEDKYHFSEEDFTEEFHQILFGSIYNLHMLGAKEITPNTIEDYLRQRPNKLAVYKANKGAEYLQKLSQTTQLASFDYYYNRMKKMTLLRAYQSAGIDLSWLYDTDNILDTKKKQIQEDWLDNTSIEEIADTIDKRIADIRARFADNGVDEVQNAGSGARELVEQLQKVPEVGYPLYGPLINTVCRGARLKKFYLRSAATGVGKAIPNDTILPTPDGYKKVADVAEGDYLFGQDGKPTKVLKVYPQPEKKTIWEITFSDGRIARCCKDHLWAYTDGKTWQVESTEELYQHKGGHLKIPANQAVEYPEREYSISPYNMGFLLGSDDNKSIPQDYLLGSIAQRKALIQGALDAGGNPPLQNDFVELYHSLGYIIKDNAIQHEDTLSIVDIKPTEETTNMTCFTVDNDSHLFLMNDFIVTHNTRSMIADACSIACDELYNPQTHQWESNGTKEPTLFITTEQELEEIQTMMLAFLSDVNEEHILNGEYQGDEWVRVCHAADLLKECPIYVRELPDFSLQDIENAIKFGVREYNTKYIFLDYIHSSMKILSEVSSKSGIKGLREDNILFMISIRLKDLCNEYGIFIMSATQLNAEYRTADKYDQNLLRGAKSIADKIDAGFVMLETSQDDVKALEPILERGGFPRPDIKISVYKNRRGRYKDILLWATSDRGTCKIIPMFATDYSYELVPIEDLQIKVEESAF